MEVILGERNKRSRRNPDTNMYPTVRLHPSSQKYISKVINKAVQNINPVDKAEASNIHRVINYKNMKALIVSPYNEGLHWRTPQIITEQLKRLVHEAYVIKAYPGFMAELFQFNPDLLIFIGNDYEFSPEDQQIRGNFPRRRQSGYPIMMAVRRKSKALHPYSIMFLRRHRH